MIEEEVTKGHIFNIQHYSIHDGPGIRTTVFLKGCPIRCVWCQNPESQRPLPEVMYDRQKCTGCGKCAQACLEGAVEVNGTQSRTKRELCVGAGNCAVVCPNGARSIMGREITAGEVFQEVAGDAIFYKGSGGGVTLSGGEPLAQPQFSISLLKLCKQQEIHTALVTCGYAKGNSQRGSGICGSSALWL